MPLRPDRLSIVEFNNLPVVHILAESSPNRVHIAPQRIRRNLHAVAEPLGKIRHEGHGSLTGLLADAVGRDQLGIRINRHKRPLVADLGAVRKARNVRLLHSAERPDFVALDAAAIEVVHGFIMDSGAAGPDLDHKPQDRIAVCVSHPLGGADRITLDQGADHLGSAG